MGTKAPALGYGPAPRRRTVAAARGDASRVAHSNPRPTSAIPPPFQGPRSRIVSHQWLVFNPSFGAPRLEGPNAVGPHPRLTPLARATLVGVGAGATLQTQRNVIKASTLRPPPRAPHGGIGVNKEE